MTQTEAGNGGTGDPGSGDPASGADGLDDLRADLARMILREAGQAVSRNPDLPLSLTLVRAIERQATQSAQNAAERIPTAEALSDAVLDVVGPELIRIARAAGAGDAVAMARQRSRDGVSNRLLILAAGAVVAGVLLFISGFVTARMLPDKAAPAPVVATAPATDPAPTEVPATTPPVAGGATAATPAARPTR